MALLSRAPAIASFSPPKRNPIPTAMAGKPSAYSPPSSSRPRGRKLPVLLFDIMDTVVRDPFYEDVPAFFSMPMKELLEHKHPTSWMEFEEGLIDEMELARRFFRDGRPIDLEVGKRKPAADLYLEVCQRLAVDPAGCIFIDDRMTNVEAAVNAGMVGIHFKSVASLQQNLSLLGIQTDGFDMERSSNNMEIHAEETD